MLDWQIGSVLMSRDDDVKCAAVVEYGPGEQGVCSVSNAAQTD
jgi:hypothetical protein